MPDDEPIASHQTLPDLRGLAVEGFRSLADAEFARLTPLSKINLLAGPNNCGKSNFLRAAQWIFSGSARFPHRVPDLGELDRTARRDLLEPPRFSIAVERTASALDTLSYRSAGLTGRSRPSRLEDSYDEILEALRTEPFIRDGDDALIWFDYHWISERNTYPADAGPRLALEPDPAQIARISPETRSNLDSAGRRFNSTSGGNAADVYNRTVMTPFDPIGVVRQVRTIDAFRQMTASDDDVNDGHPVTDSGRGLLKALNALANPLPANDQRDRAKFERIVRFVGELIEDDTTSMSIAHDLSTLVVRRDGHPSLPLDNLGSGIHQLVILISAATLIEGSLVCLEEPEIHLHPVLQRRLLKYLFEQTTNQYLIATHSAHMLDTTLASVFRVQLDGEAGTTASFASAPAEHSQICADLGYLPSDLVQTNSIIWVEGPSDRVYLTHWIYLEDPTLVEGLHYSIMFYGGRLLNHLTANDPDVADFISLRRLNRHIAILIDSDKTSPHARINKTKQRVKKELGSSSENSLVWITDGYTIENYVPDAVLAAAVTAVHAKKRPYLQGRWTNPLPSTGNFDKTAIAHAACKSWTAHLLAQDSKLKPRMRDLVRFIQRANLDPEHA